MPEGIVSTDLKFRAGKVKKEAGQPLVPDRINTIIAEPLAKEICALVQRPIILSEGG